MVHAFDLLDKIRENVSSVVFEPAFSNEVHSRLCRTPRVLKSDADCLQEMASLIAFSQGARSDLVAKMIEEGGLQTAFAGFNVAEVAALDSESVTRIHWERIRCVRFKKKVTGIVRSAVALETLRNNGFSLHEYINMYPSKIQTADDIPAFWRSFDELRARFVSVNMPYFNQLTTQLHLLLHLGFDCVKPDVIVQRTAIDIGLLPAKPRQADLRELVKSIQEYSISRKVRPGIVDLYLLVYGGQTWAMQFVHERVPRISPAA
ncbi:MAG: DNA-3-methyladenine glycosylase I [Planctomycetota bacterium]|nr:DNA-3-methyladenine glycosylase I [Planctomycetota bacterium]